MESIHLPDARQATEPLHRLLADLEERLNQAGWDQKPTIHVITVAGLDTLALREVDIPNRHWREASGHPVNLMEAYAKAMHLLGELPPGWPRVADPVTGTHRPVPLLGLVSASEGWGLVDAAAELAAERKRSGRPVPRFVDHPERVEIRTIGAHLLDGPMVILLRQRNQPCSLLQPNGRDLQGCMDGAVPQMQLELLHAAQKAYRRIGVIE